MKHLGRLVIAVALTTTWLTPLTAAADGVPVPGFGANGVMIDASFSGGKQVKPQQVVQLPGGAFVVSGLLQATGQATAQQFVARYQVNGQPDSGFGSGGVTFPNAVLRDMTPLPDGRLLVTASSAVGGLGLLAADGSIAAIGTPVSAGQLVRRPDGAVFALDSSRQTTRVAVLIKPNGSIDTTFAPDIASLLPPGSSMGASNVAYSSPNATLLSDGRLVVAFAFSTSNGQVSCGLVALNGDGHFDATFGVNGLVTVPRAVCRIDHFADGRIRMRGDFGEPVLVFTPDGASAGVSAAPLDTADLAFAGNGSFYKQSSPNEIVALDPVGNVDPTFAGNGFAALPGMTINTFALLDSGDLVAWGNPVGNPNALAIGLIGGTVGTALRAPMAPTTKFVPVSPRRILDTRDGLGAPAGALGVGRQIDLQVAGVGGVPNTGVAAVVLNVTATEAAQAGYVSVYPSGSRRPTVSNLNVETGQTAANLVTVKVGSNGKVTLFTSGGTHLVADVAGYYTPASTSSDGRLQTAIPVRILDTRIGLGAPRAILPAGGHVDLQVTGRGSVPTAGVAAVVLNLTGDRTSLDGFVTAWPTGTAQPVVSNLNLVAGGTRANVVVVPVGAGGQVSLFSSGGTDLIADVAGWFTDATATDSSAGLFVPVAPTRVLDTRQEPTAPTAPTSSLTRQIGASAVVPPIAAEAVVANITVTQSGGPGFVTAWPAGTDRPLVSNLNTTQSGQTVPNAAIVPLAHESVALYTQAGAHLIVDINGWYTST